MLWRKSDPQHKASRFVTIEAESRSQTPSLHINMDSIPKILTTFTTCTTATMQLLGIWWSVSYVLLFMTVCITEQQSSSRSTECSFPLQLEIILQVVTQHVERKYVFVYINCGHYSRLGDIKNVLSHCIIMYGVHSICSLKSVSCGCLWSVLLICVIVRGYNWTSK